MSLSRQELEKVAVLARLRLTDDEAVRVTEQLGGILDYVRQLSEVETASVAPLAHVGELLNVFREDQPRPSLDRAAALANAPKRDAECFRVPAVLGE